MLHNGDLVYSNPQAVVSSGSKEMSKNLHNYWLLAKPDVGFVVNQCLHFKDGNAGTPKSRPCGWVTHGTVAEEVVHADFLYIGHEEAMNDNGVE